MPHPRKQLGVSLLENIVALLILAFAFLATLKYSFDQQAQAIDNNTRATFLSHANTLSALLHANPSQLACIIANPPPSTPSCPAIDAALASAVTSLQSTPAYLNHSLSWDSPSNSVKIEISWARKSKDLPVGKLTVFSTP